MSYFLCNTVALQADLTKSTFKVYQCLARFANNKTRSSYKSIKTMALECGIAPRTVKRATKELKTKGLLEIKQQYIEKGIINYEKGRQTNNYYILKDIDPEEKKKNRTYSCKSNLYKVPLTGTELKVYHCLSARANSEQECFPSGKQIAKDCDMSVSTVFRSLKVLVSKAIIKMQNQFRNLIGKKAKSNNKYNLDCAIPQSTYGDNQYTNINKNYFFRIAMYVKYVLSFILSILSPSHMSPLSPIKTITRNKAYLKERIINYSKLIKINKLRE